MNDIILRVAKKDYICVKCGKIIKSGDEYLDNVTCEGKFVSHKRYHDECPEDRVVELFKEIKDADYKLPKIYSGKKYWVIGIQSNCVQYTEWNTDELHSISITDYFKEFHE